MKFSPAEESSPNCSQTSLKFPFFDLPAYEYSQSLSYVSEKRTFATAGIFTPPPAGKRNVDFGEELSTMDADWDSELSPITKSGDSDGGDVHASTNNFRTPTKHDAGDDIETMLSELKSIIHQSHTKRNERYRRSSIGSASSECDNDFLVDSLTTKTQKIERTSTFIASPKAGSPSQNSKSSHTRSDVQLMHISIPGKDLSEVRKQVDESSNNFIERIRDAAHQRKLALTRSRDDLKAKEREQLKVNAAAASEKPTPETSTSLHADASSLRKQFKARPLPETTGVKGTGGLNGVPKVPKKPPTTPFSPLLGARRPQKIKIKALEAPSVQRSINKSTSHKKTPTARPVSESINTAFKARPVPSFVGRKGQGGLTGIPKVQKRSVTVPISPVLGLRRNPSSKDKRKDDPTKTIKAMTPMHSHSPGLRGLDLLEATPGTRRPPLENNENEAPQNGLSVAYEPYSTIRAKKRADYDVRRDENLQRRLEKDSRNRQHEIQRMHREIQILRKDL